MTTTLEDLAETLRSGDSLLGLDLGTKTIGIAVGQIGLSVATPVSTIRRTKFQSDVAELRSVMDERSTKALVLGLPINMNGTEGPRVQATRGFARNLERELDTPIVFWDERLSTVAAERSLIDADVSRAKRSEVIDKMAAQFILQGALDRLDVLMRENS